MQPKSAFEEEVTVVARLPGPRIAPVGAASSTLDAQEGSTPAATVGELACELLVALAEEGWTEGDIAESIIRRYLHDAGEVAAEPDVVILGCTHFPLLETAFRAVFGSGAAIVDSASTTTAAAAGLLATLGLEGGASVPGRLELLATDGARRFARVGGQFLGEDLSASDVTIVDL